MRPAVFLDRDGTIIEERGYLDRLDLLELYSFTADAIRLLNRAGYATVVVTNQGGIGRGIIDEPFLVSARGCRGDTNGGANCEEKNGDKRDVRHVASCGVWSLSGLPTCHGFPNK